MYPAKQKSRSHETDVAIYKSTERDVILMEILMLNFF